jgi:biopolymer transport protein ExbB/TolQ
MKRTFPTELLYQLFSLALAVIVVHAVYVALVRPNAEAFLAAEGERIRADPNYVVRRSAFVMVRDYEQETCFVLMLWAFAIMGYKTATAVRERGLMGRNIIPLAEGMRVLPEDTQEISRHIRSLPERVQNLLLPRALLTALHRFGATRNVQDVSVAARGVCESEAERLDSELSMIRYITWAIPSIGFIGTVRGIGEALGQAHKAVAGDITGVTQSLGVAFNSTLIALLISIVLVFVVHQLQALQERMVLDAQAYCDEKLIRHMHVPDPTVP